MVKTEKDKLHDETADTDPVTLELVQAAMAAGLTEFTTPTPEDDDKRIDWVVRKWAIMRNNKPVILLVARQFLNPHYEVVGPEWTPPTVGVSMVSGLAAKPEPKAAAK